MKWIISSAIQLLIVLSISGQDKIAYNSILKDLTTDPLFESAHLSLSICSLSTGEQVLGYNENKLSIPASSLKLITNFSAIKSLGKDFRFQTGIYYKGYIQYDGTLIGDVIIKGGGDPTLGSFQFKGVPDLNSLMAQITESIHKAGIKCIEGDIIIDDSIFEEQGPVDSWQWNDIANYYGSGAWSLNIHENLYFLSFKRDSELNSLSQIIGTDPPIPYLSFKNKVLLASPGSGDNAYIFGGPWNLNKEIRGSIPKGKGDFRIKGSIPQPPYFFAYYLKVKLEDRSIYSNGIRFANSNYKNSKLIKLIQSPKLERIVYMSNLDSNNLYSEALFKMMGKQSYGTDKSELCRKTVERILNDYNLEVSEYKAVDGSGLSRANKISSWIMGKFLRNMASEFGIDYLCKLMSRPGNKGTAMNILKGSEFADKVWIKTGSMASVQSYSGYFQAKNKSWYSFCIIANDFSGRNSEVRNRFDSFLERLSEKL